MHYSFYGNNLCKDGRCFTKMDLCHCCKYGKVFCEETFIYRSFSERVFPTSVLGNSQKESWSFFQQEKVLRNGGACGFVGNRIFRLLKLIKQEEGLLPKVIATITEVITKLICYMNST